MHVVLALLNLYFFYFFMVFGCTISAYFSFPSFFTLSSKLSIQSNYFMTLSLLMFLMFLMFLMLSMDPRDLLQTRIRFPLWDAPPDYSNPYREW